MFLKHKPHEGRRPLRRCQGWWECSARFCPCDLDLWPLTLTFKVFQATDQRRLLCEFGANPFSGFRDIWFTNKKANKNKTRAKDISPNINRMQAAVSVHSNCPVTPPPASQWSRLQLHILCSVWCMLSIALSMGWLSSFSFFVPVNLDLLPFTLTFKLPWARDETRLPCKFGANPFSLSRDIWATNKMTKPRPN